MRMRFPSQLGLRRRVALTFGAMAFLMAVLVAVTTFAIARDYSWAQRQNVSLRQAVAHAGSVNQALASADTSVDELLMQLDARGGQSASPMLIWNGRAYDARYAPGVASLPPELVAMAEEGEAVTQRLRTPRGLVFVVALPVDRGVFFEVFSLSELERTMRSLGSIFGFTITLTTVIGVLIGGWASRRALQPLATLTAAASAIVQGDLRSRLPTRADPDLRPITDAFNSTAAALEARVERDARFSGNVSHELRTPVTAMVNAVDILDTRSEMLDEEGREVLAFLSTDVHRFAQLVRDLLETSQIDAGAMEPQLEVVPLASYVREVADGKVGRPVTLPTAEDPTVLIDKRLMSRVVENLLENAERHGGGVTRVLVEEQDGSALIYVDDAGGGVPPELRGRIFERFARVHRSSGDADDTGAGLGLALVMELVSLHGGSVWVEDSPDAGARFVVRLPRGPR